MKKRLFIGTLIAIGIVFLMTLPCYSADEWAKGQPEGSTDSPSDYDDDIQVNQEALDRLATGQRRGCKIRYASATTLTVEEGTIACTNSGDTTKHFRSNTAEVTVSTTNLDAGSSFDASTAYTIYANGDADATTFTVTVSASASTPTGVTVYAILGNFTTDGSGNIDPAQINNLDTNSNQWHRPEDIEREIGFRAYRNAALSLSTGTSTDVVCDVEDYDYGSNYSTSTGKFTCDVAGRYLIVGKIGILVLDDGKYLYAYLYKNGALSRQLGNSMSSIADASIFTGGSTIINLVVGDYLELYVLQNNGTSLSINTGSTDTYFECIKIGR